MAFSISVLFLFLYYIRPQDWMPGLAGMSVIKPLILAWVYSLVVQRKRAPVLPVLYTPHDWMVLAYFAYVVVTASDIYGTFMGFLPLVIFYALTVQSLTSWPRVLSYLRWTNVMLLGLAILAVASLFGLDPTDAVSRTAAEKGRLCIGTYMHDNPNALGHSVVLIIPLSYLLYFWRGNFSRRVVVFTTLSGLAAYCVYLTESKGAFLVGAVGMVAAITIGRPKFVQLFVVTLALTGGMSALAFLPRMNEMGSLRSDQGVQGRLMIWQIARQVTKTEPTGRGYGNFLGYISWEGQAIAKATHSSYVQVAADLGQYGMFLFVAVLWCCGRSLVAIRPYTEMLADRERCRRATFVILLGYLGSSWMINREYAAEYFLLVAVAAAMHRLAKAEELESEEFGSKKEKPEDTPVAPRLFKSSLIDPQKISVWNARVWNQFRFSDASASLLLTWLVFETWDYIMTKM